ncbi:hypothetical protein [Nocardia terpenica]|uniref:TPR repeat domain-containing protein n=1 Tax=Nocardia terpenica TaxID=455432 RepID=A0A6G9YYZ3_9NOCA|nr:hypothetical protein [Nocardia terpenica]QIS18206.1 hypothetical protein F6W96_07725 [Nocardia terpenica]
MSALTDLAKAFSTDNDDTFFTQIDGAKKFFTDATSWRGASHDAAYNRVAEDHDQARKVGNYVDDLVTAINQAASDIDSHRTVLLGKVADAEAAGLTVHDNWTVHGPDADTDLIHTHQAAIDGAYHPFTDAVSTAATKISEAAELVRAAGDLFGSDLDVKDAPAQGGRLGAEDGAAAAAAAKSNDPAAWAQVASHLPANGLTPDQMQALEQGKDVPTLPAEVQDYYREFFNNAGKDGVLGLNQYLDGQAQGGNTMAASQQRALADGMVVLTNEHVGTGRTPDGKLVSPGSYTNLPPSMRQLISGRWEDDTGVIKSDNGVPQRMQQREQLANLLSKTDPGVVGGKTFSMEVARQGASLAHYLNDADTVNHGNLPPGMPADAKPKLDTAASQLLGLGTRNHEADYQLLTGKDSQTGAPIPSDLSFGANGDQYHPTGNYDPSKFTSSVFEHQWGDKGKAASGLFEWTGSETHDPGAEGDLARKTMAALPSVLAPTHTDDLTHREALVTAPDGKTVFQHMADSFNKNPEFANSLARVSAGNLDAFAYAGDKVAADPHPAVPLELRDSQRLLMLASQTDQGRQTLDLARQQYETAALYQVTHNPGGVAPDPESFLKRLAGLDAHIDAATNNAVSYQAGNQVAQHNAQAMQSYTTTKDIADSTKKLVDAIPIPGGPFVGAVKNIGEDHAYQALLNEIDPQPKPGKLQFPDVGDMQNNAHNNFENRLDSLLQNGGQLPPETKRSDYVSAYEYEYNARTSAQLARNSSDLEQLATGGAQAPK